MISKGKKQPSSGETPSMPDKESDKDSNEDFHPSLTGSGNDNRKSGESYQAKKQIDSILK